MMLQNVTATEWLALKFSWQASVDQIQRGEVPQGLSVPWRMFLLGDGSPTRHLQLMTGEEIIVDVLAMDCSDSEALLVLDGLTEVAKPWIRRQVWLCTASGVQLAYAVSWWTAVNVDTHLADRSLPIWKNLVVKRTEHFREIRGLYQGSQPQLSESFGVAGELWGRHYLLWHGGRPLTLIYEVFSPLLQKYLGNPTALS
jgi:chorismate lyase